MSCMTEKPKISVIIPVYNTEDFLAETLESVLAQDYDNLEILLVDDGSTDNSGHICDLFAERDCRIRCFHIKNGGASAARNYALAQQQGDYVTFVDSDDLVKRDYVSQMLNAAEKCHCDLVICRYTRGGRITSKEFLDDLTLKPDPVMVSLEDYRYEGKYSHASCCFALYSARYLEGLRFDTDLKFAEDSLFFATYLKRVRGFAFVDEALYFYRRNNQSVTRKDYSEDRWDEIRGRQQIYDLFQGESRAFRKACEAAIANCCIMMTFDAVGSGFRGKEHLHAVWRQAYRLRWSYLTSRTIGMRKKMKFFLYVYMPSLYMWVIREKYNDR